MTPFARSRLTAILLVTIAAGSAADTNYYRWLDSRGNPIHSDRPPPIGTDYEVVSTESTFTRAVGAEEGAVPLEVEPSVGNQFTPQDSNAAQRSTKNPELCQRSRANLKTLNESDTVIVLNDKGEQRALPPAEMKTQRKATEAQVKLYCE